MNMSRQLSSNDDTMQTKVCNTLPRLALFKKFNSPMQKSTLIKIIIFVALAVAFAAAYPYVKEYLSLQYIQSQQSALQDYYAENQLLVIAVYFFAYIAVVALSLPGAAVMTLLAGAVLGFWVGVLVVSFASSIGATLAFLVARFLLGDSIQKKHGDKLAKVNEGVEKEGAFYLFAMRLVPAFPFFLINLLMAFTKIPTFTFYWVTQAGALAGTMAYVYAGKELSQIKSLGDILSPTLIAAFAILGLLPIVAKKALSFLRNKRGAGS